MITPTFRCSPPLTGVQGALSASPVSAARQPQPPHRQPRLSDAQGRISTAPPPPSCAQAPPEHSHPPLAGVGKGSHRTPHPGPPERPHPAPAWLLPGGLVPCGQRPSELGRPGPICCYGYEEGTISCAVSCNRASGCGAGSGEMRVPATGRPLVREGRASPSRSGVTSRALFGAKEVKWPGAGCRGGSEPASKPTGTGDPSAWTWGAPPPPGRPIAGAWCLGEAGGAPGLQGTQAMRSSCSQPSGLLTRRESCLAPGHSPAGGRAWRCPPWSAGLCASSLDPGPMGPEARPSSSIGGGA